MADSDTLENVADRVDKTACCRCGSVLDVSSMKPFTSTVCPRCSEKITVPGQIGQFLLLKCMGRGGMGVTYRALDKLLKRQVAIKVMHSHLRSDAKMVEGFFREARSLASLNHANVAQVYFLGLHRDLPYIVMELVSGGRLDKLFIPGNPLGETRAMDLAIDVIEGLMATHAIGLVHGDVKPSNILLDERGTAKLVDFGMARLVSESAWGEAGLDGTPYYIAPEQARKQKVDFRADIYSLGATLYHALSGQPPFPGKTAREVIDVRLERLAPPLGQVRPGLCPNTSAMIARMMAIDPEERYKTYNDLLTEMCNAHSVSGRRDLQQHLDSAKAAVPSPAAAAPEAPQTAANLTPTAAVSREPAPRRQSPAKTSPAAAPVRFAPAKISVHPRVPQKPWISRALPFLIGAAAIIAILLAMWLL